MNPSQNPQPGSPIYGFNGHIIGYYPQNVASIPYVQLQPASPATSPSIATSLPVSQSGAGTFLPVMSSPQSVATQQQTQCLSPLMNVPSITPTFTSRMLLDSLPPEQPTASLGTVFDSSTTNELYGTLGPLVTWPHKRQDIENYELLKSETQAIGHPINQNPLSSALTEADIVQNAILNYIIPINIVLSRHSQGLRVIQQSESTRSAKIIFNNGEVKHHVSRADMSWAFLNPGTQQWVKFAVLEFKREGGIDDTDWNPGFLGGEVEGKGAKACRQVKKYAYAFRTRYVGICDGKKAVLMRLGGEFSDFCGTTPWTASATPAHTRYIQKTAEIKRNIYLWLIEALVAVKTSSGI